MEVRALHQVAQRATDLDESIAFYRDVLGLHFVARFDPPGLAFFDLGGTRLLLEQHAPTSVLYLLVDDIQRACADLRARGVVTEGEPHVVFVDATGQFGAAGEAEWMAFLRDPDDNLLALVAREPSGG
jgi:methylmalonyl-CoA/ethylmalonyl-CoA epimerase